MTDETNPKDLIGSTKPDLALIPPVALVHQALAHKNGSDKYGAYNWRDKKVQMMIYLSAIMRHCICIIDGEDYAEDSGILHFAHIAAGCNIVMDAQEGGNLIDDRPKKGHAPEVLKKHSQDKNKEKLIEEGPSYRIYLASLKEKRKKE